MVKRSTLCQVEGSFLASMFSGRWEESLDRDHDGRVYLELDPPLFKIIISELRSMLLNPDHRFDKRELPSESSEERFRDMIYYLGLESRFRHFLCRHNCMGPATPITCFHCQKVIYVDGERPKFLLTNPGIHKCYLGMVCRECAHKSTDMLRVDHESILCSNTECNQRIAVMNNIFKVDKHGGALIKGEAYCEKCHSLLSKCGGIHSKSSTCRGNLPGK